MATIRPKDLPSAATVTAEDAFVVDNGATVSKATPAQVVDAAIPLASQAEAEAGTDNAKRVTPLRVKQAIDANMASTTALASTAGAGLVGTAQAGTGALASDAATELRRIIWADQYDTLAHALAAAAGKRLVLGPGTYTLSAGLGTLADNTHIVGQGKGATIIKKAFNGDVATLGLNCSVSNLSVDGDGSNYTGRGFVISSGSSSGTGFQKLRNVSISNMAGYCVEWAVNAAGWGGGMFDCDVQRTGNTGACLKMPDSETNGNRALISVFAGSGPLVDFAGAANVTSSDCATGSGAGPSAAFFMTAASAKIQICNWRCGVGGGTTTLLGQNHTFVGNSHAGPFNFGDGTTDSLATTKAAGNDFAGYAVTYNPNLSSAASANDVQMPLQAFAATWTTGGTAPSIGNGGVNSSYQRNGQVVTLTIEFTGGSTTTFGTGAWSFALPIKAAARKAIGSASMIDASAGAHYLGAARVEENAAALQIYPQQANIVQDSSPFAWASGDTLVLTISYFAV